MGIRIPAGWYLYPGICSHDVLTQNLILELRCCQHLCQAYLEGSQRAYERSYRALCRTLTGKTAATDQPASMPR